MHLRRQIIQRPNPVTSGQEGVGEMGSDEAGAACDQDMIAHTSVSAEGARAAHRSRC
jgi:hypothetical protein